MKRILACIAVACLAACASAPQPLPGTAPASAPAPAPLPAPKTRSGDGGIVGTGARIECEGQTGTECKRDDVR